MEAARPVELGCGPNKIRADATGIDALALPGVDVVGEIPAVLGQLPSGSADVVFSNHFLEHAASLMDVMEECGRLLDKGGTFIALVPHFSNPYFYSDPTHRTAFGLYSMSYLAHDDIHQRPVPKYVVSNEQVLFRLRSAELHFGQSLRQPVSYLIGRAFEGLARRSRRFKEYYECRLAWIVPCEEVRFELERI